MTGVDLYGCGRFFFFIALTGEKVGWGDGSEVFFLCPLDLKMQQTEQHSVNVVSLRTKLTLEAGC